MHAWRRRRSPERKRKSKPRSQHISRRSLPLSAALWSGKAPSGVCQRARIKWQSQARRSTTTVKNASAARDLLRSKGAEQFYKGNPDGNPQTLTAPQLHCSRDLPFAQNPMRVCPLLGLPNPPEADPADRTLEGKVGRHRRRGGRGVRCCLSEKTCRPVVRSAVRHWQLLAPHSTGRGQRAALLKMDLDCLAPAGLSRRLAAQSLSPSQASNAALIIARVRSEDVGAQGCHAAITAALTESTLIIHANEKVPESLKFPHDRLGYDQDSVGLFQHRAVYYPDIACDMDPGCSAGLFLADMKRVPNWQTMSVGVLVQKVQRSERPERFFLFVEQALNICAEHGV
ncbi:hypothetical protein AAL_05367 [Moelleriella libera RCEF 2490]|uniref:Uncharacterized protein n=1 Tax=Moelleriella libera RCEF 2490 TaxID=1081109 RepID=A0A166P4H5_9HYPO|nr:hypothetical protein AAL_05367 [Moelleriella libera RCEF 2490]